MKVRDLMTEPAVAVTTDTPFAELVRLMISSKVSGLPVVDADGHVLGVVSEGDLIVKSHRGEPLRTERGTAKRGRHSRLAEGLVAGSLMSVPAVTIDEDAEIRRAARLLSSRGIKRLPVTRHGRLIG